MRIAAFTVAGIATLASAAPIKILLVPHTVGKATPGGFPEALNAIRVGHPAVAPYNLTPPTYVSSSYPPRPHPPTGGMEMGMGCSHRLKAKLLAMSNRLRKAMGMSAIASHPPHDGVTERGDFHILPFMPPPSPTPTSADGPGMMVDGIRMMRLHVQMLRGGATVSDEGEPFVYRLHDAINRLGPWEGRAVAFVLGCGLGVLFRMFFVFAVLLVRRVRRSNNTPDRQIQLSQDAAETYVILPPRYSSEGTDEKGILILSAPAPDYDEVVIKDEAPAS